MSEEATEGPNSRLRAVIARRYGYMMSRLSASLGSRDLAQDALHDAFVRLERAQIAQDLREPTSYLLRMATNIAYNRIRRDSRLIGSDEMREILEIPDENQNPESAAQQSSEMKAVEHAMHMLPERRRTILTQAWLDERSTADLAHEHGISVRMVQLEIKAAVEQIRAMAASPNVIPFRKDDRKVS
ncbi:RNA polymerase sigma factor [Novosphingobium gossypii]|uniref:RNA polymerase sigma factor n=1 Tax=Novosphingobium gossypii TaxID=1604774 RepID=UPI003D1E3C7A